MSIFKELALPTTLDDLLTAREEALRLMADARRTLEMAEEVLAPHGRYLMPHAGKIREDQDRVRRELDTSLWRRAFDMTGFNSSWTRRPSRSLRKAFAIPPEFTASTISATFIDLRITPNRCSSVGFQCVPVSI